MKKYNTLQEVVMALKDNNQKGITIIDRNDNRRTKTYSDFFSSVFCQAAFLLQQGYQKGERVVVLVSDALKELELFWALIMIGAVPIPIVISDLTLDNQKEEKIRGALKATSPDRMLVDSVTKYSLESVLSGDIQQSPVVQIVSDLDKTLTDFDKPEFQTVQTDDPAIILLSSGTVGVPKGIILTHNNILSAVVGNVDFHNFTEQTTFLNWMVVEHMASVSLFHILPTVLQANQVHVATLRILENATRLPEYLSEFQVNATFAPNFVYDLLLQKREEILPLDITLSSVTAIINGGENINFEHCDACMNLLALKGLNPKSMIPAWGMTETASGALYSKDFGRHVIDNHVSVGKPTSTVKVKLLDDNNQEITEDNVEGELLVKGKPIFSGYTNTELEGQNYFRDGWFKTGDRAIFLNEEVVIMWRQSDIFIMNGLNINTQELDQKLKNELTSTNHSTIKSVPYFDQKRQQETLLVFVEETANKEELWNYLASQLSIPNCHLVLVPQGEFPLTSIGKIHTKALINNFEQDCYQRFENSHQHLQTTTLADDNISKIRKIWSKILAIDPVLISADDNFFHLGGSSVNVPEVLNQLKNKLGIQLNAAEFVQHATIDALLSHVNQLEEIREEENDIFIL